MILPLRSDTQNPRVQQRKRRPASEIDACFTRRRRGFHQRRGSIRKMQPYPPISTTASAIQFACSPARRAYHHVKRQIRAAGTGRPGWEEGFRRLGPRRLLDKRLALPVILIRESARPPGP